ncbi:hypothetical protein H696_01779 [Fonticula alba]|uniref:START domain-containing protein n=1 Tax=Fonticula alba TaxID=691883 RepID=A0A058ZDC0_FONAL|nr:hypothetical protein H696_01779 [Fonticula alba]KCV72384.1 hypothetical protein H696_01779 [Fonticula alba]|eukprot:XP_009493962.1 hypothetical protein H696_01779 [Fonticula alba]
MTSGGLAAEAASPMRDATPAPDYCFYAPGAHPIQRSSLALRSEIHHNYSREIIDSDEPPAGDVALHQLDRTLCREAQEAIENLEIMNSACQTEWPPYSHQDTSRSRVAVPARGGTGVTMVAPLPFGVDVSMQPIGGARARCRAVTLFPHAPPGHFLSLVMPLSSRAIWDDHYAGGRILRYVDGNTQMAQTRTRKKFGVAPRDFVLVSRCLIQPRSGALIQAAASTDAGDALLDRGHFDEVPFFLTAEETPVPVTAPGSVERCPGTAGCPDPGPGDHIRGWSHCIGWVLEPVAFDTRTGMSFCPRAGDFFRGDTHFNSCPDLPAVLPGPDAPATGRGRLQRVIGCGCPDAGCQIDPAVETPFVSIGTRVTYIGDVDLKGWIPRVVMGFVSSQMAAGVLRVAEAVAQSGGLPFPVRVRSRALCDMQFFHRLSRVQPLAGPGLSGGPAPPPGAEATACLSPFPEVDARPGPGHMLTRTSVPGPLVRRGSGGAAPSRRVRDLFELAWRAPAPGAAHVRAGLPFTDLFVDSVRYGTGFAAEVSVVVPCYAGYSPAGGLSRRDFAAQHRCPVPGHLRSRGQVHCAVAAEGAALPEPVAVEAVEVYRVSVANLAGHIIRIYHSPAGRLSTGRQVADTARQLAWEGLLRQREATDSPVVVRSPAARRPGPGGPPPEPVDCPELEAQRPLYRIRIWAEEDASSDSMGAPGPEFSVNGFAIRPAAHRLSMEDMARSEAAEGVRSGATAMCGPGPQHPALSGLMASGSSPLDLTSTDDSSYFTDARSSPLTPASSASTGLADDLELGPAGGRPSSALGGHAGPRLRRPFANKCLPGGPKHPTPLTDQGSRMLELAPLPVDGAAGPAPGADGQQPPTIDCGLDALHGCVLPPEAEALRDAAWERALHLHAEDKSKWTSLGSMGRVRMQVYMRADPQAPLGVIACRTVIDGMTPRQLLACVYDNQPRRKWDVPLYDWAVIRRVLAPDTYISQSRVNGRLGVSARDMVVLCHFKEVHTPGHQWDPASGHGGTLLHNSVSFGGMGCPQLNEEQDVPAWARALDSRSPVGCVRMQTHVLFWAAEPAPDSTMEHPRTMLTHISMTDPCGWLPKYLLMVARSEIPLVVDRMADHLHKHGPSPYVRQVGGAIARGEPAHFQQEGYFELNLLARLRPTRHLPGDMPPRGPSRTVICIPREAFPFGADLHIESTHPTVCLVRAWYCVDERLGPKASEVRIFVDLSLLAGSTAETAVDAMVKILVRHRRPEGWRPAGRHRPASAEAPASAWKDITVQGSRRISRIHDDGLDEEDDSEAGGHGEPCGRAAGQATAERHPSRPGTSGLSGSGDFPEEEEPGTCRTVDIPPAGRALSARASVALAAGQAHASGPPSGTWGTSSPGPLAHPHQQSGFWGPTGGTGSGGAAAAAGGSRAATRPATGRDVGSGVTASLGAMLNTAVALLQRRPLGVGVSLGTSFLLALLVVRLFRARARAGAALRGLLIILTGRLHQRLLAGAAAAARDH